MRFYVMCRFHGGERIYITFQRQPRTRSEIPVTFNLTCPTGVASVYTNREVIAEVGAAAVGGAVLGGLLFLIDPLLGLAGMILGAAGANQAEQQSVDAFNQS